MRIHVVKQGDNLWDISQYYGVDSQRISQVNGLNEQTYLIVGQALVIPTTEQTYTVQSGDTLWSISQRFGVPWSRVAELNNLTDPYAIMPGMALRIPEFSKQYGYLEVNGYSEPVNPQTDRETVNNVGRFLTYISPFSYQVNADGSLDPLNDEATLQAARPYNIAPLMVLTNFEDGNFSAEIVDAILKSDQIQNTLIDNVLNIMKAKGYAGVNIDFERIPPASRQLYNDFLRKVVARLRPQNLLVSTALAPKTSDLQTGAWHGAHDYKAHGEIVDFVIIMTYEWGWSGGPPMAVAPIKPVEDVIRYAASVMPANKIIMGVPLYGYNWTLPYVSGGRWARRVSPQGAVLLAGEKNAQIQYDTASQSPFFNYWDPDGTEHVVWFEDARSIQAKYLLANQYGLRGVSYWLLGLPFPQNWYILNDMFNIVKLR